MQQNIITKYTEFQQESSQQDWDIDYLSIGLAGEVGELLNEIKKSKRDDNNTLTETRINNIEKELGDILWYYIGITRKLGLNLNNIMETNIIKLQNNTNIFNENLHK